MASNHVAGAPADRPELATTVHIETRRELGRADRKIYGHFLEGHFFGNIHGGVFDEGSPLAIDEPGPAAGLRRDVIEVCRALGVPVVRWPGGNYASAYHWEDGIGPREARPRRLELTWGGREGQPREEDNRFGTDEFLAWCALAGAEPYLNNNARSVEEAVRWVEYTNYAGDTHYTRLRAANGHPEPYGVRYWGLGNEVYGAWQMGHRSAEQYAADAREHARFMRLVDPSIRLVGVGWHGGGEASRGEAWTRALLQQAGSLLDYVSIHLYGASCHLFAAAQEQEQEYEAVVAQPLAFEAELRAYAELVRREARRAGIERPLALALDEWNMRHLEPVSWPIPQPGADGDVAPRATPSAGQESRQRLRVNRWSPRTLADALFYAGVFHALQRCSGLPVPVGMANTVNLVNANAPIVVRPAGVVKAATYYVWELYQHHIGPLVLPVVVEGPAPLRGVRWGALLDAEGQFVTRQELVPYVDVVATLSEDRHRLHVAAINRHRTATVRMRLVLDGGATPLPPTATRRTLGAELDDVWAYNTLSRPDRVATRDHGSVEVPDGQVKLPPHSITVLSFARRSPGR